MSDLEGQSSDRVETGITDAWMCQAVPCNIPHKGNK